MDTCSSCPNPAECAAGALACSCPGMYSFVNAEVIFQELPSSNAVRSAKERPRLSYTPTDLGTCTAVTGNAGGACERDEEGETFSSVQHPGLSFVGIDFVGA